MKGIYLIVADPTIQTNGKLSCQLPRKIKNFLIAIVIILIVKTLVFGSLERKRHFILFNDWLVYEYLGTYLSKSLF